MAAEKLPRKFETNPYIRRVEKPWGWELHFTPDNKPYMGKILHIKAGKRLSLQLHDKKKESWLLISGRAKIIWEKEIDGVLIETEMKHDLGYSCDVGQRHRLFGITDCDIVEVSTPEIGTTFRLDDDFKRHDETPKEKVKKKKGAT